MDIFYFKTSNSSFVLTDKKILEEAYAVQTYHIDNSNGLTYIPALFRLALFLVFKGRRASIYFIRFADWHTALIALFKKLYRKKLVIVVGGFDAFHLPQYAYGVYHRPFRGWCARFALRNATLILPNSPALIEYTNTYASSSPIKGGIRFFEPRIKGQIKVIYNGFEPNYWTITGKEAKTNTVMTVAIVDNLRTFYLKGIDSFIELAERLPQTRFKIIGLNRSFVSANNIFIPGNLEIIERLPHSELLHHYAAAKVFCLFSLTEGMSNVLCEAMLCECIPVGSNVTFIPEIIADTGFIVCHKDVDEMEMQLEKALKSDPELGRKARQRIIQNYSIRERKRSMLGVIQPLLKWT